MESKAKFAGHPVHPMLVVFPLGLLISSLIFDIIYYGFAGDRPTFAQIAFWDIGFGLIGGLLAAVFGLVDWVHIPKNTRAKRIGLLHALTMVAVVGLFFVGWLIRFHVDGQSVPTGAFLLSLIAVAIGAVGGWLGGELVDRLGVGVDEGANVDAPSSLTRRVVSNRAPAHDGRTTHGELPQS